MGRQNALSTSKSSVWIFSVTWFADVSAQPIAHKVFERLAKRFVYQWEIAPSTKAQHLQGYVNLKKRAFPPGRKLAATMSALGMKGVTCKVASDAGKALLKAYCMKLESRMAGPWADRVIYCGRDLACMQIPHPWQHEVMSMIEKPPDDRTVIWIDDLEGNVGKTKLLKYMCYNKLAKRVPLGNATQLKTNVITQGPSRCYCVDLPRTIGTTEKMTDLISALEEIKGGWVASAMYGKHQELFMEPPHLIVFSNMAPPKKLMSGDRWRIYKVENLKLVRVVRNINIQFQGASLD